MASIHDAFADSRSTDYVYVPNHEGYFYALDDHAEISEVDSKLPLVIIGRPGSGKSALLANWVKRRRDLNHHKAEFLFQHFVECSSESQQLSYMLFRLETALKEHFQLREMEVPPREAGERLRWGLPRFLEAASRKHGNAPIVIVIDGVNRLRTEGSPEGTLHWLPTELPVCVRFIVSTCMHTGDATTRGAAGAAAESSHHHGHHAPHHHHHHMGGAGAGAGDDDDGADDAQPLHRTFTELRRRGCPTLTMEPLSMTARVGIIRAFSELHQNAFELDEAQQAQVLKASATSQPLYLRILLHSLRLGVEMSNVTISKQLDKALSKPTAEDLVSYVFDQWESYVDRHNETAQEHSILGRVLSMLYVSRHGLSSDEIWGSVAMAMGAEMSAEHRNSIQRILRDVTMVVSGLRSFSHEAVQRVVWKKYIRNAETNVRLHSQMARYFGKLPACDRKLEEMPYHLEISGSWAKLRQALVSIEMFELWWTPKHKGEFIKLWASLTVRAPGATPPKLVTGDLDESVTGAALQTQPRPFYDIVEEYTRSVDEFANRTKLPDEDVAAVILKIADFLLEFATSGHEVTADVPHFLHPQVPNDDLASLGVPFLDTDEDGRSVLNTPAQGDKTAGKPSAGDAAVPNPTEDFPVCSTYFYRRWMWIQFPWVAVANCGRRYVEGIRRNKASGDAIIPPAALSATASIDSVAGLDAVAAQAAGAAPVGSTPTNRRRRKKKRRTPRAGAAPAGGAGGGGGTPRDGGGGDMADSPTAQDMMEEGEEELTLSLSAPSLLSEGGESRKGLPYLPSRIAPRRQRTISIKTEDEDGSLLGRKLTVLKDNIFLDRQQLDTLVQTRTAQERTLERLTDEMQIQAKLLSAAADRDAEIGRLNRRYERVCNDQRMADLLARNYRSVTLMAERHPAKCAVLIEELESQMRQDKALIREEKNKLRLMRDETHDILQETGKMRDALHESRNVRAAMIDNLNDQREFLETEQVSVRRRQYRRHAKAKSAEGDLSAEDEERLHQQEVTRTLRQQQQQQSVDQKRSQYQHWEQVWENVSRATGITDPHVFFEKYQSRDTLEAQMGEIRRTAEARLHELKEELASAEQELEEIRYGAISAGGNSRDLRERDSGLAGAQTRLKRNREKCQAAQTLLQHVRSGLVHIGDIVGLPDPPEDEPVFTVLEALESLLGTLVEEKDKTAGQDGPSGGQAGGAGGDDVAQGGSQASGAVRSSASLNRLSTDAERAAYTMPPELELALERYSAPKARLPAKLVTRVAPDADLWSSDEEDDDENDAFTNAAFKQHLAHRNGQMKKKHLAGKAEHRRNGGGRRGKRGMALTA